jgi:quinoprotein glucose dehydrogenase
MLQTIGDGRCAAAAQARAWQQAALGGLAGALLCLGACSKSPSPSANAPPAPAATGNFDFAGWDQYLGGVDSSQYSSLDQVNKSNVGQLTVAWTYPTGENYSFNPLVIGSTMYVLAKNRSIVALDATTGKELWVHANEGPVGTRGMSHWRSADGSEERLLYLNAGFLTAIDAKTGATIPSFGTDGRVDLRVGLDGDITTIRALQTNNPGRVFEDLIIMSLPAGSAGYASSPADVHAYNVRTGALVWVFHTVPRPGEFGADTWPEQGVGSYGGVHNWSESTVDTELGIIYVPTGTARYDFYGANRVGENLFADSLLALDARSGKRLWHFQMIHHDLWDYDLPTAPKLLTVKHDGIDVPAVAQPSKQGFVYVFNRITGAPLWPIEERAVPQSDAPGEHSWPTQPFPTAPPPFARQKFTESDINPYVSAEDQAKIREILRTSRNEGLFTPPSMQGTIMLPGHNGGANWGSSAVDPKNGRLFVVSKELPTTANLRAPQTPAAGAAGPPPGAPPRPTPLPSPNAGPDFVPYTVPIDFMIQPSTGLSALGPPWSQITAYDLNKGTILWQIPDGDVTSLAAKGVRGTGSHAPRGGVVATGGGLLFIGTSSDRKFRAYDADTGNALWSYDLDAATEGVPAVYSVEGRQYVAIAVGGGGLFSQGLGQAEPGPGKYMVFALARPPQ